MHLTHRPDVQMNKWALLISLKANMLCPEKRKGCKELMAIITHRLHGKAAPSTSIMRKEISPEHYHVSSAVVLRGGNLISSPHFKQLLEIAGGRQGGDIFDSQELQRD